IVLGDTVRGEASVGLAEAEGALAAVLGDRLAGLAVFAEDDGLDDAVAHEVLDEGLGHHAVAAIVVERVVGIVDDAHVLRIEEGHVGLAECAVNLTGVFGHWILAGVGWWFGFGLG